MITSRIKQQELYADFTKTLTQNPVSLDLVRVINDDAVKESIKNLLTINRGERLFQPNLGSDIRRLLFETATPDTLVIIKDMVTTTIEKNEPRCSLIDVEVTGDVDSNAVSIKVMFVTINNEKPQTVEVFLDRVR